MKSEKEVRARIIQAEERIKMATPIFKKRLHLLIDTLKWVLNEYEFGEKDGRI